MSSTRIPATQVAARDGASSRRITTWLPDLLLPASIAMWAYGVSITNVSHLGDYGLPPVLPIVFYAGIGLLVVSATIELLRTRLSPTRMGLHATALVVMLYGTAPLVYQAGRYSWLYKTIGVVQYVNTHGRLNTHIDIYQNWPGFFALAAYFDKVAGVASPLVYAKWAQLVFELAALPLLYIIYDALALSYKQRWVALMLYSAANWVGQDYFSPQALGTILSLGIMALAMRWLSAGNFAGVTKRTGEKTRRLHPGVKRAAKRTQLAAVGTAALLFLVLTFTHELSPYLLLVQLGVLMVPRLLRPRWLPFLFAAIALGYFVPHFEFVNNNFGIMASIGNFFGNVAPPSSSTAYIYPPHSEKVIEDCQRLLSLGMWALALLGAWMRRRSRRTVLTLLILTFSPFLLLGLVAYGNEGILRVYLFSLPWAAALVASAVAPVPRLEQQIRADANLSQGHARKRRQRITPRRLVDWLGVPVALAVALVLFFPSFFGDDGYNVQPQSEVTLMTELQQNYPPGPVYSATGDGAQEDTAQYDEFTWDVVWGDVIPSGTLAKPNIAYTIAQSALSFTDGGETPAYVVVGPNMQNYSRAYGVTYAVSFQILLDSLAKAKYWKLLYQSDGTYIYELPKGVTVPDPVPPAKKAPAKKAPAKKAPAAVKTTPAAVKTTPAAVKTTPAGQPVAAKTTPAAKKTTPAATKTTPAAKKTTPAATKTTPAATKTTPAAKPTLTKTSKPPANG